VLNEAAIQKMAMMDPIGQRLTFLGPRQTMPIIGVMKDFNTASLHQEIGPLAITLGRFPMPFVSVRIRPNDVPSTLAYLEQTWNRFLPGQPFEYSFLDQDFNDLYQADQRLGQIFTIFAGLAILIACLGLFGLASFTTQQRTKEIGVRKALGASVPGIVVLLSKEFTKLVLIAFVIAAPVAYFAMQKWLEDFAYRTSIGALTFAAAGIIALLIAWLTVSYQSIRAASIDPVKALRYE
jgi:putative ABC transport system permease protein